MSYNGGSSSRVSIPNGVRKTIQDIKEITGNHSEEDIYAMLKECSMDPNETTQRLLHLDTFHDVKRKRAKRNENVKGRPADESRGRPGYPGRGTKGTRGNSYSQYTSKDAGGRWSASSRKENGVRESREKGVKQSPAPVAKEEDSIQLLHVEKSSFIAMNGPVKVPNGILSGRRGAQSSGISDGHLLKESIDANAHSSSRIVPKTNISQMPSASDTVLFSQDSDIATAVGTIKHDVQIQEISGNHGPLTPDDNGMNTTDSMSNIDVRHLEPRNVDGLEASSSMGRKEALSHNVAEPNILDECSMAEDNSNSDHNSTAKSPLSGEIEEAASKLKELKFPEGQHVIIPDHIQVPDAIKSVLSFGSLDANFGVIDNHANSKSDKNSEPVSDFAHDEIASKPPLCDQDVVSAALEEKNVDNPQSPSHVPGKDSPSDPNVSCCATVPKNDTLKEEILPAADPRFPVIQTTPSYSFGFVPPMLVNPPIQSYDSQAPLSNSLSGSSPPILTPASTPPPAQSAGAQNSVAISPQSIALLRQPFPPNYIPYNHYYPFYVSPTMHQYFGHTTFPPPLPTGNVYLTPPPAAGMKISPAPYKVGANTGNHVLAGFPPIYGAYSSSQVAFNPNVAVASGNSCSSEDRLPSALKENNIYPVQQSEAPAVWHPPQVQPMILPQSAPGAFAVYHTMQSMATPPPLGAAHSQPIQPMVGLTDSVCLPSNGYQLPPPQRQQQQMNWNM